MRISDWSSDVCSSDLKRAVTDNDAEVRFDPATKPGVSNLLSILAACTGDTPEALAGRYSQYGPLKTAIGRASCRERVGQDGENSVVAVSLKKKDHTHRV